MWTQGTVENGYLGASVCVCVCAGYGRGRVPDGLGGLPRLLGVAGAALPDPRGLHHGPLLPVAGLHAAPGHLGHAVGPGEVSATSPARQQVFRQRGVKFRVSLLLAEKMCTEASQSFTRRLENLEKSYPLLRNSQICMYLLYVMQR